MAFVISRLCRDHLDTACADVCPVDCIYVWDGERPDGAPAQLLIHPEECVDCGLCVPACPWEAIFPDDELPASLREDLSLNALTAEQPELFRVAVGDPARQETPAPEEIAANRRRYGLGD